MTRPQDTSVAKSLACCAALLESTAHVHKFGHECGCAEYVPSRVALKQRLGVTVSGSEKAASAETDRVGIQNANTTCKRSPTRQQQTPLLLQQAAPWQQQTRCRCLCFARAQLWTRCKEPDGRFMLRVRHSRRQRACTATMRASTISCIGKCMKSKTAVERVSAAHLRAISLLGETTCALRAGAEEGASRTRRLLMRMRRRRR
jgi:hypothetical protein